MYLPCKYSKAQKQLITARFCPFWHFTQQIIHCTIWNWPVSWLLSYLYFICSHEVTLRNVTVFMKFTNPYGWSYLVSALGGLQLVWMVEVVPPSVKGFIAGCVFLRTYFHLMSWIYASCIWKARISCMKLLLQNKLLRCEARINVNWKISYTVP